MAQLNTPFVWNAEKMSELLPKPDSPRHQASRLSSGARIAV